MSNSSLALLEPTKEYWQMTWPEFAKYQQNRSGKGADLNPELVFDAYMHHMREAITKKLPIPSYVLKQYQELLARIGNPNLKRIGSWAYKSYFSKDGSPITFEDDPRVAYTLYFSKQGGLVIGYNHITEEHHNDLLGITRDRTVAMRITDYMIHPKKHKRDLSGIFSRTPNIRTEKRPSMWLGQPSLILIFIPIKERGLKPGYPKEDVLKAGKYGDKVFFEAGSSGKLIRTVDSVLDYYEPYIEDKTMRQLEETLLKVSGELNRPEKSKRLNNVSGQSWMQEWRKTTRGETFKIIHQGVDYTIRLTHRYYPKLKVFTWVYVNDRQIGDPLPKRHLSYTDIIEAIENYIQRVQEGIIKEENIVENPDGVERLNRSSWQDWYPLYFDKEGNLLKAGGDAPLNRVLSVNIETKVLGGLYHYFHVQAKTPYYSQGLLHNLNAYLELYGFTPTQRERVIQTVLRHSIHLGVLDPLPTEGHLLSNPRKGGSKSSWVDLYENGKLELETWFERDRAFVGLRWKDTDDYVYEVWDDKVESLIEDGYLDPKDYGFSLAKYMDSIGITIRKSHAK